MLKNIALIVTAITGSVVVNGGLFVVRDSGAAIGVRRSDHVDTTWRVLPTGTQLMGYGHSEPRLAIGYAEGEPTIDGSFLELTTSGPGGDNVGLSINDRSTGAGAFGIYSDGTDLVFIQLNFQRELLRIDQFGNLYLREGAQIYETP